MPNYIYISIYISIYIYIYLYIYLYSGPPLMRPPLENENCGCIRGGAASEELIIYIYEGLVLKNCGCIRGVAAGESGRI